MNRVVETKMMITDRAAYADSLESTESIFWLHFMILNEGRRCTFGLLAFQPLLTGDLASLPQFSCFVFEIEYFQLEYVKFDVLFSKLDIFQLYKFEIVTVRAPEAPN